jgi:hypothetical protein
MIPRLMQIGIRWGKSEHLFDQSLHLTILKFGLISCLQEHMVDQGIG